MSDQDYRKTLAQNKSSDTHFEPSYDKMYYYVREPYMGTDFSEDFAQNIVPRSVLCDGQICIDGSNQYLMTHGDSCEVDIEPAYSLKCFKFVR